MNWLFTEPVHSAFQYEISSYMPVTLRKGRLRKTPSPQLIEWGSSSIDSQFPILGSIWLSNFQGNMSSGWPKQLLRSAEHLGELPYCLIHFCGVLTQTPRNDNLNVMRSSITPHVRKICTICCEWHLILVSQGRDSWMIMPLTCFFPHQKEEKPSKTGKTLAEHHSHMLYWWLFFIFQTVRMFCAWCCTTEEQKMTLSSKSFQRKTVLATERWTNTVLVNIVFCELNFCYFA